MALTQTRCGELMAESQRAQQEVQLAMREHDEYKLRAAGILQVGWAEVGVMLYSKGGRSKGESVQG